MKEEAATRIQAFYRGHLARRFVFEKYLNLDNAEQFPSKIMLLKRLAPHFAKHLAKPRQGPLGYYVMNSVFKENNLYLERNAVRLSNIEPHHEVLEIGFGPGHGLAAALLHVEPKLGGSVCGVDWSDYSINHACQALHLAVEEEYLFLIQADAARMPFLDNKFNSVFHTNCYYFWGNNMEATCREIHRVLKPDGHMTTCLNYERVKESKDMGLLPETKIDPLFYMTALERAGFKDIKMDYLEDEETKQEYQSIIAKVGPKRLGREIEEAARREIEYQQDIVQRTL